MPYVNIKITKEGGPDGTGPSPEQKAQLIEGTTTLLKTVLGKDPSSTFVVIDEIAMEDWGFGGLPVESIEKRCNKRDNSAFYCDRHDRGNIMRKLKIEMVHDLVCSWCPIGYNNIQTAISNLNIEVDFKFLPYELNPEMSEKGETIASYFKRQFGWNDRKLLEYQESLVETALSAGIKIDFSKRMNYYNTKKAHKLMHWAERFNKQTDLNERLITAYMEAGQDISNTDILLDIAVQVGLDRVSTENALSSAQLAQELDRKIERRKAFKIQSIPAFILDENTLISGSNSVEFFEKTLSTFVGQTATNKKLLFDA